MIAYSIYDIMKLAFRYKPAGNTGEIKRLKVSGGNQYDAKTKI